MKNWLTKSLLVFSLVGSIHSYSQESEKPKLSDFGYNIFSQYGEDGVLGKIFDIIGTESKTSIEFGAWDGFYLSNTALLWTEFRWHGILIESEKERYKQLVENTKPYDCQCIHAMVGEGNNSLESILKRNKISIKNIDLLSIDIDNDDYYIFKSLQSLRPRVIVCEYNPTFPADIDIYPEKGAHMGSSVGALVRIAKEKEYSLVAITNCNCFFVRNEDFSKFNEMETDLAKIRINRFLRYIISDFDGNYSIIGQEDYAESFGIRGPITYPVNGKFRKI